MNWEAVCVAIKGDINEMEHMLGSGAVEPADARRLVDSIKNGIFLLEEILNEFREFVMATQLDSVGGGCQRSREGGCGRGFSEEVGHDSEAEPGSQSAEGERGSQQAKTMLRRADGKTAVNFQPEGARST